MGRKAISGEPKRYRLQIRLTEAERAILERASGEDWLSSWAREVLLKEAETEQPSDSPIKIPSS